MPPRQGARPMPEKRPQIALDAWDTQSDKTAVDSTEPEGNEEANAEIRLRALEEALEDRNRVLQKLRDSAKTQARKAQLFRVLLGQLHGTVQSELKALIGQNQRLKHLNGALMGSTSWRLTAPLRALIMGIKNLIDRTPRQQQEALERAEWAWAIQDYDYWVEAFGTLTAGDRRAIERHISQLALRPKISVLMPVCDPDEPWLRAAIESVRKQLYPDWELCIADDASTRPHVHPVLKQYQGLDNRIKVTFRRHRGHIAAAANSALGLAAGEFVALLDHDDELSEHALYRVAIELNTHPDAGLIYSDEDKIDAAGQRFQPYFKPDWNPELFLTQNVVNHLGVYRTDLMRSLGGFREGYEGAQDWDLALRVTEKLDAHQIRHIPDILYHWRAIRGSTALAGGEKTYTLASSRKALQSHFRRTRQPDVEILPRPGGMWRVRYPIPKPEPKVSLLIPTRNGYELLALCVESIFDNTDYPNFELVIIDNASDDPKTLAYFQTLARRGNVKILRYPAPFNFSAINNFAVRHSDGELIGFLNNDLEVIASEWLNELVSHALRPGNGAVGAKLYYPDGRIQHAGVILGIGAPRDSFTGVAGHAYVNMQGDATGQMYRAQLAQNLSAVTAACLVMRRAVFEQAGGFDEEHLQVAYNDVDLCLRIQELGYRNVWTPFAELYHHESASRGYDHTPDKAARYQNECDYMRTRWGERLDTDTAHNPNLDLISPTFRWALESRAIKPWRDL